MKLSNPQRFILFTLGTCHEKWSNQLKSKVLEVFISKKAFIEILKKAGITEKKERSLYKNLENLENRKYISYNNKTLKLTKKGEEYYSEITKEFDPYFTVSKIIESENLLKFTKKAKAGFKLNSNQ